MKEIWASLSFVLSVFFVCGVIDSCSGKSKCKGVFQCFGYNISDVLTDIAIGFEKGTKHDH